MSADVSGIDWPLVLGSCSAVVLLLCSVAVVAVVAHRKGIFTHESFSASAFFLIHLDCLDCFHL